MDTRFPAPKADIRVRFVSKAPTASAEAAVTNDIVQRLFVDSITELAYMAEMAEISCSMGNDDVSLTLRVCGFSSKVMLLLQSITEELMVPKKWVQEESFSRQVERLEQAYVNETMKANQSVKEARLSTLKPVKVHVDAKLAALQAKSISTSTVLAYLDLFFSCISVDVLAVGNLTRESVLDYVTFLKQQCTASVSTNPLSSSSSLEVGAAVTVTSQQTTVSKSSSVRVQLSSAARPDQCIIKLPVEAMFVLPVLPRNPAEKNICVEAYFQYKPFSLEGICQLEFLEHLLKEPFFDSLRTKQQLGYTVGVSSKLTHGVLGFSFMVISSSHSVEHVQGAIMQFIEQVPTLLAAIDVKTFDDYKCALVTDYLQPETSLYESANNVWDEIEERRFLFGLRERQGRFLDDAGNASSFSQESMGALSKTFLIESPRLLVVQSFVHQQVVQQQLQPSCGGEGGDGEGKGKGGGGGGGGVGEGGGGDDKSAATTTATPAAAAAAAAAAAISVSQTAPVAAPPQGIPVVIECYQGRPCVVVGHYSDIHKHRAIEHFPSLV